MGATEVIERQVEAGRVPDTPDILNDDEGEESEAEGGEVERLQELCTANSVGYDGRWGETKLKKALMKAGIPVT